MEPGDEQQNSSTPAATPPLAPQPRERKSKATPQITVEPPPPPPGPCLNPFGDEDEDDEDDGEGDDDQMKPAVIQIASQEAYPDDLNPFGDDDDDPDHSDELSQNDSSLNPFGDDDDQSEPDETKVTLTPTRRKKRPAPLPPSPNQSSQSLDRFMEGSGAGSRTPTPTPRRSKISNTPTASPLTSSSSSTEAQLSAIKSKKRPAPPRPAYKRSLKTPTEDMDQELSQIGDQLPVVEQQLEKLQQWLAAGSAERHADYEAQVERFLEVAKQKCQLARRQKELMYMRREMKLEEIQLEVEYQLRVIMSKQGAYAQAQALGLTLARHPEAQKTAEDAEQEQRLLQQMMEIIEERNDIIENMIQDENRVIEEYQSMVAKALPPETWSSGAPDKHAARSLSLSRWNKKINKTIRKLKTSARSTAADGGSPKTTRRPTDLASLGRSTLKRLARLDLRPSTSGGSTAGSDGARLSQ